MKEEYKEITDLFLRKIKTLRDKIAVIYLFGSRARGTCRSDSDYDMVLVTTKKDIALKNKLYDAAVDVFMETGADISLKILKKDDFDRFVGLSLPFFKNLTKEGVKIG